jgi:lactose/L-arabinose transport system ATP-binding protein
VSLEGDVTVVERLGGVTYVHASVADGSMITVESRGEVPFSTGTRTRLGIDAQKVFLFDGVGKRV